MRKPSTVALSRYRTQRRCGINEDLFEDADRMIILAQTSVCVEILRERPYYYDRNIWKVSQTFRRIVDRISNFRARTLPTVLNYYRDSVNLHKETEINYLRSLLRIERWTDTSILSLLLSCNLYIGDHSGMKIISICMTLEYTRTYVYYNSVKMEKCM